MPFIPHTEEDIREMLAAAGVSSLDDLFRGVPAGVRSVKPLSLPPGKSEAETAREARTVLGLNRPVRMSFAGAGAYEHHVPAVVRAVTSRGEFLTAYTPYQAEASQGSLQAFFEFQSIVCRLTGMDVANASLYEAGSALAEAVLMAHRATGRGKVLVAAGVNPLYRRVLSTYLRFLDVRMEELPAVDGVTDAAGASVGEDACAVVVQHPNFFGCMEPVGALAVKAKAAGALVIGCVNPVSLGLLKPPGEWGADIATGDVQPVGVPLSFGGPYAGFLACRMELVRRMPGRLVGMTKDTKGRRGFTLTLQAREQHIRREKATSNICSNEALVALSFTVAASLLGGGGLRRTATISVANARRVLAGLSAFPGVGRVHGSPFFHEFALALPFDAEALAARMADDHGIVPGVPLSRFFPGRSRELLVCVTDARNDAELDDFVRAFGETLIALTGGKR